MKFSPVPERFGLLKADQRPICWFSRAPQTVPNPAHSKIDLKQRVSAHQNRLRILFGQCPDIMAKVGPPLIVCKVPQGFAVL